MISETHTKTSHPSLNSKIDDVAKYIAVLVSDDNMGRANSDEERLAPTSLKGEAAAVRRQHVDNILKYLDPEARFDFDVRVQLVPLGRKFVICIDSEYGQEWIKSFSNDDLFAC